MGILDAEPEVEVVSEAGDGLEAVALTQRLRPDVVGTDVRMPGLDGFQATREILVTAPTPIVLVTACAPSQDVESTLASLRAGALAVLPKPPARGRRDSRRRHGNWWGRPGPWPW